MPNKILTVYLVLLLACSIQAYAEPEKTCPPATIQPTVEMAKAGAAAAHDHGFLWRISKDGITSYLYGTIHAAKYDWMFPGDKVRQAVFASDTVALELDMLDADIQGRLVKGMLNDEHYAIPESLQKRLQQQAEAVCAAYEGIARLSPEIQAITLSLMSGRWDGLNSAYAIDTILAATGHAANKHVVSLETPELQLNAIKSKTAADAAELVEDTLKELESGHARILINRLANSWADSDAYTMEHYEDWCECMNSDKDREMSKALIDERNPNLADKIESLHSNGKPVFAAVGSMHMFGALGLPTLMAERGFQVEQIRLESQ